MREDNLNHFSLPPIQMLKKTRIMTLLINLIALITHKSVHEKRKIIRSDSYRGKQEGFP